MECLRERAKLDSTGHGPVSAAVNRRVVVTRVLFAVIRSSSFQSACRALLLHIGSDAPRTSRAAAQGRAFRASLWTRERLAL
jgi:hypothetical protein